MIENIIVFTICSMDFAIDLSYSPRILQIDEFIEIQDISTDDKISGNLMPDRTNLINIADILGLEFSGTTPQSRILVFDQFESPFGFIVDEVKYFLSIDTRKFLPGEELFNDDNNKIYTSFIQDDKLIHILNLNKISGVETGFAEANSLGIGIARIEDFNSSKKENDLIGLAIGIKRDRMPTVVKVNREGNTFEQSIELKAKYL